MKRTQHTQTYSNVIWNDTLTMQIALWTFLGVITLAATVFSKSISTAVDNLSILPTMSDAEDYMTDELERLKQLMRSRAPSINNLSQLNITIEAKRKLLRQYREKLHELNLLDIDSSSSESVHKREFYSYQVTSGKLTPCTLRLMQSLKIMNSA